MELTKALLHMKLPDWAEDEPQGDGRTGEELRRSAVLAILTAVPDTAGEKQQHQQSSGIQCA